MRVSGLFEALAMCLLCGFAPACGMAAVTGRVMDYLARPVEGAQIALYEKINDPSTDRDIVRLRDEIQRTDAEGRFAFTTDMAPSYRVFLVARKEGLALGWDVLMPASDNAIVLEKPCVLAGVVVNSSGHPVAGAKVRAVAKTSYLLRLGQRPILGPEPWITVETDDRGVFRFEEFRADASADFEVEAPGRALVYTYTPHRMTACGFEAGQTDIRLVLPEEVAVRGRVVDAQDGEPVAEAQVVIHPDTRDNDQAEPYLPAVTITGLDGRFLFQAIPPGRHYIDVRAPYETGRVDQRVRFEVQAERGGNEVVIRLNRGGTIEVEAREEGTNAPIPHLSLYFAQVARDESPHFCKDVRANAEGRARLRAPGGLCTVDARIQGYSPSSFRDQVSVTAGETAKLRIVLKRYPAVSGLVVDESGRPVGGARVNEGATDEAGRFEVPFPSDESLFGGSLIVRHTGENLAAMVKAAYDGKPMRITLNRALTVSGRIVDPNDKGLPAARVALHIRAEGGLTPYGPEILTDSQGRYEMKAVLAGPGELDYRISVHASGYGSKYYRRVTIAGAPGGRVDLDAIVLLPADQTVAGIVLDAEGRPVVGQPMEAHGSDQPVRNTVSGPDGRFVLRRVCKGPVRIQAGFSSLRAETGVVWAEGGDRDVTLVMGQDRVHPRSASLLGKPLPESADFGLLPADGEGRIVLLCFFDVQQRPSRAMIVELAGRAERLAGRGVAVFGIQASQMDRAQLDRWITENHVALPIRMVQVDEEQMRRTWGVQSLPWLVLADRARIVTAEGPQLAELERQSEQLTGGER